MHVMIYIDTEYLTEKKTCIDGASAKRLTDEAASIRDAEPSRCLPVRDDGSRKREGGGGGGGGGEGERDFREIRHS